MSELIEQLKALDAGATGNGRWALFSTIDGRFRVRTEARTFVANFLCKEDAALIVHLRNSVPAIIAMSEELEAVKAKAERLAVASAGTLHEADWMAERVIINPEVYEAVKSRLAASRLALASFRGEAE